MSHSFLDDDRFLISGRADDYRAFLLSRHHALNVHHSADVQLKRFRVRPRRAGQHAMHVLRSVIAAFEQAQLRRIERELRLRNIRYDRSDDATPDGQASKIIKYTRGVAL